MPWKVRRPDSGVWPVADRVSVSYRAAFLKRDFAPWALTSRSIAAGNSVSTEEQEAEMQRIRREAIESANPSVLLTNGALLCPLDTEQDG